MGGELNFDYRYAWLRDLSLTIRSLWIAACPDEPARLFDWFTNAAGKVGDELFQIMYGSAANATCTSTRWSTSAATTTAGRSASATRRGARCSSTSSARCWTPFHQLRHDLGALDERVQELLVALADRAASGWAEPDAGMWEARDAKRQHVSSKVMCWVALDRAITLADPLGTAPTLPDGEEPATRSVPPCWSRRGAARPAPYTGAFGSDDLDASVLLLPLVGFLPADDARMLATLEAIERGLGAGGLVRRWPGDESGFLICTFWLAECLAMAGEVDRAEAWFDSAAGHANDVGLLSEEAVPGDGPLLGNFPQAFSHVGLVNAAWRITQASRPREPSAAQDKETP